MADRDSASPDATTERQFAVLRAIAADPGLGPERLRDAVEAATGHRWALATLYKDIAALKAHGLLEPGRNRQGYHLAGAGFAHDELQVLLNGLRIQAEDLANPQAQALYDKLLRRAGVSRREQAFYALPVEAIANRPVVRTLTDGVSDVMDLLREPLLHGQKVGLEMCRTPWSRKRKARRQFDLYPLQFLFHDVAWYLLAEDARCREFVVLRLDRIHPALAILDGHARGSEAQAARQALARSVLRHGWGMAMPAHDARGQLTTAVETFELRFAPHVAGFIAEGEFRHATQRVRQLPDGAMSFAVELPRDPAVVFQFRRWILTWGRSVEVVAPPWFRSRMAAEHTRIVNAYIRAQATGPGTVTFAPAYPSFDEIGSGVPPELPNSSERAPGIPIE